MKNCPDCKEYKEALEFCAQPDLFEKYANGSFRYNYWRWFGDVARDVLARVALRNRKIEPEKGLPAFAQISPPLDVRNVGDA